MSRLCCFLVVLLVTLTTQTHAGPYPSHLTSGIDPNQIAAWGKTVVDYSPTSEVVHIDSFGGGPHDEPVRGLGAANGTTVSLGDLIDPAGGGEGPGSITIGFQATIVDGPGADFAVFENAGTFFNSHNVDFIFAELAFVEVSSNGSDFARFPAVSLNIEPDPNNPDPENDLYAPDFGFGPLRDFAGINTTNVKNLAGVHPTLLGTPFDLSELSGDPLVTGGDVDLNGVRFVRLIDIPGDGSVLDSLGNPIVDTWHSIESGGFDLDAVGAINKVPEPATIVSTIVVLLVSGLRAFRPSRH